MGQCLADDFVSNLSRVPSIGKKTKNEINLFLRENKLDSLILLYWPSDSEIDQIVQSQQLFVGRTVAKSIDGPATIEGEVVALLHDIVDFRHQLALFKRFGVIDDCMPYTLQEIGEIGFEDNIPITRERVRQIEAKYLRQLKNSHFFLKKCSIVESF